MHNWPHELKKLLIRMPLLPTFFSMGWNFFYGLINGLIALLYMSHWYLTLCAYYLLLGMMRLSAVTVRRSKRRKESDMLLHSGLAMIFLSIVMCGMMIMTVREYQNPAKNKIVMLVTAAYTFAFIGMSIRNIIIAHRKKLPVLIAVRNISCASAIGAFISLERGMIGTFGEGFDSDMLLLEEWSGAVAFILLIILGINLILFSRYVAGLEKQE